MVKFFLLLVDMRKPYKAGHEVFLESSLEAKEPFAQFKSWFDQACVTPGILEANAMCLATATKYVYGYVVSLSLTGRNQNCYMFF